MVLFCDIRVVDGVPVAFPPSHSPDYCLSKHYRQHPPMVFKAGWHKSGRAVLCGCTICVPLVKGVRENTGGAPQGGPPSFVGGSDSRDVLSQGHFDVGEPQDKRRRHGDRRRQRKS